MPELTVIVPVYNVSRYLGPCLDSVLAQDYEDYEILLVDDGSPDDSGQICDRYAAAHPGRITVVHQQNGGLGNARNTGLKIARGNYILCLDSDDTLQPGTLRALMESAARFDFPDMVLFTVRRVDEQGRPLGESLGLLPAGVPMTARTHGKIFTVVSANFRIVRRELYLENQIFFPEGVWFEDLGTTPKLAAISKSIYYLDQPFYNYLIHPGTIMGSAHTNPRRYVADMQKIFDGLLDFFHQHELFEAYREELCGLALWHMLYRVGLSIVSDDPASPLIQELTGYLARHFPGYENNRYIDTYKGYQRWAIRQLLRGHTRRVAFLFHLKQRLRIHT